MRILLIDEYGYEQGGGQVYASALIKALRRNGHTVALLASDKNGGGSADFTFSHIRKISPLRFLPYIFNPTSFLATRRAILTFQPDIIHINAFFYNVSPSILYALGKTPTVVTLHNADLLCPLPDPTQDSCSHQEFGYCRNCIGSFRFLSEKLKRLILKPGLKHVQYFISPSVFMKRLYEDHGYPPEKLVHLVNGFDIPAKKIVPMEKRADLVLVARLASDKGVHVAIDAMPKILKTYPRIHLTIIGDGPESKQLISLRDSLGLQSEITFAGRLDNKEVSTRIGKAKAILVPSTCKENLPTVCIEAMLSGTPILASNTGGLPEMVVDGKNGLLFPSGDEQALADSTCDVLGDERLQERFSVAAVKFSLSYAMPKHIKRLLEVYANAIKNN